MGNTGTSVSVIMVTTPRRVPERGCVQLEHTQLARVPHTSAKLERTQLPTKHTDQAAWHIVDDQYWLPRMNDKLLSASRVLEIEPDIHASDTEL